MADSRVWNRNIVLYTLSSFISHFELISSVFVLYLFSKGLSMTEAMTLQAIFIAIIFLTEVPSGAFADLFGLKTSLVLSNLMMVLGFLIYAVSDVFWQFLFGELCIALAWSFYSGTNSALIYDSLKERCVEDRFKMIRGITNALVYLSLGIAAILGGYFLERIGFLNVFIFSTVGYFIGLILLLFLKEPKKYEEVQDRNYFRHLREGLDIVFKRVNIRKMVIFFGLLGGTVSSLYMILQPYLDSFEAGVIVVGIGIGLYFLVSAVGSYYADRILERLEGKDYEVMIAGIMLISLSMIALYFVSYWLAFVLISLIVFILVIEEILIEHEIHVFTKSSHRATVISVKGMMMNVFYIIVLFGSGYAIDSFGPRIIMLLIGSILFVAFIVSVFYLRSLKVAIEKKKSR